MSEFEYTARTREGKTVTDIIEAPSRASAGELLRSQGLLPVKLQERRPGLLQILKLSNVTGRVSLLERLTFIKNLAVTLKAGLPVSKALTVLTKQMPNAHFREVTAEIAHNVESGKTLSESMRAYPRIFPPLVTNMVMVGEQSGDLDQILDYLASQISRDYNLIRKTKGALTYPAVVVSALIIIGYLMFTFVLPKLTATFKEFNTDLPPLTRIILAVVDFASHYSFFIAAGMVLLAIGFVMWRKTPSGRRALHKLNLIVPILKNIVKKLNLARFTIIFTGLLRAGMPIVEALRLTGNTMTNVYYQEALLDVSEKVKLGVDLVLALEKYPKLFTPMVTQMIKVGEESGTMEKVLGEVSNFYEQEIDDTVKNLSSIIEPVLVMIIGAFVGVLAVGLILPIYNIGQSIQ